MSIEDNILFDPEQFAQTARAIMVNYGVNLYDVPVSGETLRSKLARRGDHNAEQWAETAETAGNLVSPVVGQIGKAVTWVAINAVEAAQSASCLTKAENRRDILNDEMPKLAEMCGDTRGQIATSRVNFRFREALPILSGVTSLECSNGIVRFGGWGVQSPPSGMHWTDGSSGSRRGVDGTCGTSCQKYAAIDAMRLATSRFVDQLQPMPLEGRQALLVGVLGICLGPYGDPTQGLEHILEPLHVAWLQYVDEQQAHAQSLPTQQRRTPSAPRSTPSTASASVLPLLAVAGGAAWLWLRK